MESNFNKENEPWEFNLDIDDSNLHLTPQAKLLKERDILLGWDEAVMSTQEYMQKVVEDVDEDDDFNSGAWVSATNYVNSFGGTVTGCLGDIDNFLKKGKLEQVVAIVKSCSPNMLGDLIVTLKDLSCTIPGIIHYKVLDVGIYGNDITVGAAMIQSNVSVFTPKPSHHYLNITMRNVIEVFRKDTVLGSGSVKNDLRNAYEKCTDILQESRALIDSFLKEGSDKGYELNLSMYGKAAKLEKQMDAKLAWLLEKYYYRSQESVGCSSSQADLYLTEKELHQLHLDEEALRETLEEQAIDEKAREEKIRQKQADDDEFFMEFEVVRYDLEYESSD
ncbi:reverse transcriptase domain-containing protein [Tanacetum coccineum]